MNICNFTNIIPINKGWSKDKKYHVKDENGHSMLLRLSNIDEYEKKRIEYCMMEKLYKLKVPMCKPIIFGICKEGVYSLQSWINGDEAEEVIPFLSDEEAYSYGIQAGQILVKIHSLPIPQNQEEWSIRFNRKINAKLEKYKKCNIKIDGDKLFIQYINRNRDLLEDRPQCFQHGDYHIGNMMIEKKELKVIDFNRYDYGDPWEEFNRIVWCVQKSPIFASGMIDGYFNNNPSTKFWRLLALYISINMLASVPWAIPFGKDEIDTMQHQASEVIKWYNGMQDEIPSWYIKR